MVGLFAFLSGTGIFAWRSDKIVKTVLLLGQPVATLFVTFERRSLKEDRNVPFVGPF